VVKGTSADDLVKLLMRRADRHLTNGILTVNELRTFLPNHDFTNWLTRVKGRMLEYDVDGDGGVSMSELHRACEDFLAELYPSSNAAVRGSSNAAARADHLQQLKKEVHTLDLDNGRFEPPPKLTSADIDKLSVSQLDETERLQDAHHERTRQHKSDAMTARMARDSSPGAAGWASGAQTQRGAARKDSRATPKAPAAARGSTANKRAGSEPKRRGTEPKKHTGVSAGQLEIERLSKQLEQVTAANALLKEEAIANVVMQEKEANESIKEQAAVNVPHMQLKLSQALAAQHDAEQALERECRRNKSLVTMVEAAEAENQELKLSARSAQQKLARVEQEKDVLLDHQAASAVVAEQLKEARMKEKAYLAKIALLQQQLDQQDEFADFPGKNHLLRAEQRAPSRGGSRVRFQDL